MVYGEGFNECLFCDKDFYGYGVINKNDSCYAVYDLYPVSEGHCLIIPFRHVENFWQLTDKEILDMHSLAASMKSILDKTYRPTGYNVGWNCGKSAGQTVMHCHMHIIPRYDGDIDNPEGGIRGCIPEKRIYLNDE